MDAAELVMVLCGVAALGAAVVLSLVSARLLRAARSLEVAAAEFDRTAAFAVTELQLAAADAVDEVARIDALVEVAGSIGQRVDSATDITYRALTSPVIKGVAFATGTRRTADRLRGRGGPRTSDTSGRRR